MNYQPQNSFMPRDIAEEISSQKWNDLILLGPVNNNENSISCPINIL